MKLQILKSLRPSDADSLRTLKHSLVEDAAAMVIGTLIISFATVLIQQAQTLIAGTAGIALLIYYLTSFKFGIVFFVINLPFYILSYMRLGLGMTIKTFIAILLMSYFVEFHHHFLSLPANISPLYLTIMANILFGLGFIILFRHRSSLGGVNLLAFYIQDAYKIPVGKVQMIIDISILMVAFFSTGNNIKTLLISVLGAVILNLILIMNHKPERYIV